MRTFLMVFLSFFWISAAHSAPGQPTEAEHPGSAVYPYDLEAKTLRIDGRKVDVFLPVGADSYPVIVFGHGQAIDVEGYRLSFEHLAKKGVAVIHPQYDSGFFDQQWRRMAKDFVTLTEKALDQVARNADRTSVIFSGHSKGAYVALMAAGIPKEENVLRPQALVLFNLAGYDREWLKNVDPSVPVTLTWSEADTVIKESLVREVYQGLQVLKKQLITVKSYSDLTADHFFPLSKSYFFGGKNGTSAFHFYGVWKWLMGAALDLNEKSGVTNPYIYGSLAASSGQPEMSHDIERNWSDILVQLENEADLSPAFLIKDRVERIRFVYDQLRFHAQKSQRSLREYLDQRDVSYESFYLTNSILVKGADEALTAVLLARPEVRSVSEDVQVAISLPEPSFIGGTDFFASYPSNITWINAHKVWEELGVKGKGIVIAGQDTGYDVTHPAIQSQYRGYSLKGTDHLYNWYDGTDAKTLNPNDDSGHGTHTMGNMVGDGGPNRRIGVAPEAQWIGCRNMVGGVGTPSTYIRCFQFFLAPHGPDEAPDEKGRPELAPHIINNSWSCPPSEGCQGEELLSSVQAMKAAGIFVVVAAGNSGSRCQSVDNPPAMYSGQVFSVGAFNSFLKDVAWFSSRGPSAWDQGVGIDLVAPGAPVVSSVPGGGYEDKMGTSMASPHVAGAVALLWSHRPELIGNIDQTALLLTSSASPRTSSQSCGSFSGGKVPNAVWGHGLLDTYQLLAQ